ncbi:hypothetical protein EI77_04016 [Prosthecobacter fusiformis]|uniref:Uncharacterized protein n=2 Tax=Prosthecobacter fusiformis TaxID=48464 RepID=A0A4R7RLD1_9BACT|nr:hypothetical protein EI77_04016 [Prosthecobacter fusiformis]
MTDPSTTLWLQTLLVLAVMGAGLMLHLKWHPLRECFSDAWDMLQSFGWLVPLLAALHLLSGIAPPWGVADAVAWDGLTAWRQMLELVPMAARDMAVLTHGFFPPWPSSLAAPVLLSLLVWKTTRLPYRYGSRRKRPALSRLLISAVIVAWCWMILEGVASVQVMPEWLETLRVMLRWLMEALTVAGLQVFMIRLVMGWDEPTLPSDEKDLMLALEQTLACRYGILALAALDLLWLMAWRALDVPGYGLSDWLMVESSLLFAGVPVVVARVRGSWTQMTEVLAHVFLKTWLPLIGFALTATVVLMLVHFSMRSLFFLLPDGPIWGGMIRILVALVLATVRSWLFLTLVLTLIRHGLKSSASSGGEN